MIRPIFVVIDTETSGLPLYCQFNVPVSPEVTEAYDMARIVDVCAIASNYDGAELLRYQKFVNPKGPFRMSPRAQEIHGLTEKYLSEKGVCTDVMLGQVADLLEACGGSGSCVLVGHNIRFDWYVLMAEAIRANHRRLVDLLSHTPTYCTMMSNVEFCGLRRNNGRLKWPKLTELYALLFPDEPHINMQHSALGDALATAKCFFATRGARGRKLDTK